MNALSSYLSPVKNLTEKRTSRKIEAETWLSSQPPGLHCLSWDQVGPREGSYAGRMSPHLTDLCLMVYSILGWSIVPKAVPGETAPTLIIKSLLLKASFLSLRSQLKYHLLVRDIRPPLTTIPNLVPLCLILCMLIHLLLCLLFWFDFYLFLSH